MHREHTEPASGSCGGWSRTAAFLGATLVLAGCAPAGTVGLQPERPNSAAPKQRLLSEAERNQLALRCLPSAGESGNGFVVAAPDTYLGGPGRFGPWLKASGDFGFSAEVNAALPEQPADLGAFGALPQGEYWRGTRVVYFGLRPGRLAVSVYMGTSAQPALSQSFSAPGSAPPARLGFRREAGQLVFKVGGGEVGRIVDPGLFPAGEVYLGANVAPHNRLTVRDLAIDSRGTGLEVMPALNPIPASAGSLRSLAAPGRVLVGAFAEAHAFLADNAHRTTLGREFNLLSLPIFPAFTAPTPVRFDFCLTDSVVAFAQANRMQIRGDTLVYHHGLPAWLTEAGWSSAQLSSWLHGFISAVVGRYRGQVQTWEVTDEIFNFQDGNLQDQFWRRSLGPKYVEDAFRWAHEADPKAALIYNDNSAEGLGAKSDAIYGLVKDLRQRGVPIDGVGLQAHFALPSAHHAWSEPPSQTSIAANLKRLHELGLTTHITEMDVLVGKTPGPADFQAQARLFKDTLATCQADPGCRSFMTWGVGDRYSWIRVQQQQPWELPLLFDDSFQPKPAYLSVSDQLRAGSA